MHTDSHGFITHFCHLIGVYKNKHLLITFPEQTHNFVFHFFQHGVRAVCPSQIYLANITHIRFVVMMNLAVVPATTDTAVQTNFCSSLRINKDTGILIFCYKLLVDFYDCTVCIFRVGILLHLQ